MCVFLPMYRACYNTCSIPSILRLSEHKDYVRIFLSPLLNRNCYNGSNGSEFLAPEREVAPCVDGSELARKNFTSQDWSVQPCVRPVDAVHMTAGHNALRGSGPGQKPAFDDALAHMGCPDRRIDRLCITCCSPSQPSHHAGCPK